MQQSILGRRMVRFWWSIVYWRLGRGWRAIIFYYWLIVSRERRREILLWCWSWRWW